MTGGISDLDLCNYQAESSEFLLTSVASNDLKKQKNQNPKLPKTLSGG